MEEFARFLLDDASQSEHWKRLRHDLAAAAGRFPRAELLLARDTEADVGTGIGQRSEYQRESLQSVIAAAASRTQQSLRALEEYGKLVDASAAAEFEQLRYRSYTLAANLELGIQQQACRGRLQSSSLYALIDCHSNSESFAENIARLADAGVDLFQLRDPSANDRTLLDRARIGTLAAHRHDALLIVNDRADIAVAADADGVHVGQQELPVAETRRIVGPRRLIGVSTHSIDQARQAVADGADYIGCGPVFPGRTKSFESYPGIEFLRQIVGEIQLPAFAIGGIDAKNLSRVIDSGIRRIAVTAAICDAQNPPSAAAELKKMLAQGGR